MRYEQKAALQDGNKARMYEERYKKWRKKKTNEIYEEKKKLKKDKTFHITISELTAKTIEVKAKNKDMAWDKIQNDGYWEYEQIGDDKCIEWNYADCEEVNE